MVVKCPQCGKTFDSNKIAGKKEICNHCDAVFTIDESTIYGNQDSDETQPKNTKKGSFKRKKLLIPVAIFIVVIVLALGVWLSMQWYNRYQAARHQQTIEQENLLKAKIDAGVEKRIADENARKKKEEHDKIIYAYRQLIVEDFNYNATIGGGFNLNSIKIYNPTPYEFLKVRYAVVDIDNNTVAFSGELWYLNPYERKKFTIGEHFAGLWEHKYEVQIITSVMPIPEELR